MYTNSASSGDESYDEDNRSDVSDPIPVAEEKEDEHWDQLEAHYARMASDWLYGEDDDSLPYPDYGLSPSEIGDEASEVSASVQGDEEHGQMTDDDELTFALPL